MSGRICRTAEEAFQAGWEEACEHGTDPAECRVCGLTDMEIARLVVLVGHLATPVPAGRAAA
ncbi:MAG TPA: hypothetical protein VI172_10075 [Candidatus Dormibacteraeota bacterium]|jgi:hypothetical protein